MTLFLFLLLAASHGEAGAAPVPPDTRLEEADAAFRERRFPERARKALRLYGELLEGAPRDPELGWRFAMASQMVGHRLTKSGKEKETIFAKGRDAALEALKVKPDCGPCHFWAGINMAQYAETVGPLKMLFTLKTVRNHLKQAAQHDPAYAFAGAYRVLGLIDQRLPGILGGSDRRAREYFEKAIETVPDNPLNYFFLARLLAKNMDEPREALKVARQGLSKPSPDPSEIESAEARTALETLATELSHF